MYEGSDNDTFIHLLEQKQVRNIYIIKIALNNALTIYKNTTMMPPNII
jgi:hypothetical protein